MSKMAHQVKVGEIESEQITPCERSLVRDMLRDYGDTLFFRKF